jgi:hypothetical protein
LGGGCLLKFNVFVTQGQTKHTHETAPTKEDSQLGISLHLTLVITFIAIIIISLQKSRATKQIRHVKCELGTYGSSRLKLRPLHPFVGLEATNATSTASTAQHTTLKSK